MHVIGTAGHVDHGKSSLVQALTGTNPDRWIEERIRGMTLDLGFAHLRFDDGVEAGVVDVPGHERFLHNMLAGAAGMELLLLVVAANEGVRTQTLEHLNILRFLNVRRTIVALTKIDLVAPERQGEVCRFVHHELQETIAADAPIFAVSTVTGANLEVLKAALHDELAALEARDADAPVYLPIDRVFTLPGRGTIATGTLMQGRIANGDSLTLAPSRKRVRVRSLHVFGSPRDAVRGGSRVAVNMPGIEKAEIGRGEVLGDPRFAPRASFSIAFRALSAALPLLRRRNAVRAHVGSAEILGTLVLPVVPGENETVGGELFLKSPALAFPGVRFVVRRVSPKTLLGGGEVLGSEGASAPAELRDAASSVVLDALTARGDEPSDVAAIAFAANVREEVAARALAQLVEAGDAMRVVRPEGYVSASAASAVLGGVESALEAAHEREPWAMGLTSLALARAVQKPEPALIRLLNAFAEEGRIAHRSGYYATTDHIPKLTAEQRSFFETHVPVDPSQPFLPASFDAVAAAAKATPIEGLPRALETLLVRGVLVRVGESLYRGSQIEAIHGKLEAFIGEHGRIAMAEFRNLLGTSRKFAVPLLEWFDGRAITVRSGDYRMLRRRSGVPAEPV